LRSSSQSCFSLPTVEDTNKKRSGARAFSNAAHKLWNSLPDNLKNIESASLFRKKLKAFLFLTLTSSLYYQPRQSSARGVVKMWPQKHNFKVYRSVLYIILKEIDLST
jgi:hypothetical protein